MSADQESNSNSSEIPEQSSAATLDAETAAPQQSTAEPIVIRGNVFGERFIATPQATLIAPPAQGTLSLKPDGSFDFDPGVSKLVEGEVFSVVFRYQFTDESGQLIVRQATLVGTTEWFEVENQSINIEQLTSQLRLLLEAYDDAEVNISMRPEAGVDLTQLQTELAYSLLQRQAFDFVEFSFRSIELGSDTPVEDIVAAIRAGALAPPEGGEIVDQSNETDAAEIVSGPGDDIIVAGAGGDTVAYAVGQGNDTVDGGAGFDLVTVDLSAIDDSVDPSVPAAPASVTISAVNGNVVLDGGDFELTLNGVEEILLTGGDAGGSFIIGDLTGTDIADDTIILRGGDGALEVVNGSDRSLEVSGTPGADTLTGGSSTDLLVGYGGNDSLVGGAGNDTLGGGAGVDTLEGGAGDDRLDYTIGDKIDGGSGTDTLQVFGNTLDTARLAEDGVTNIEKIDFISNRSEIITVDLDGVGDISGTSLEILGGSEDTVFITDSEWSDPTSSNGFQVYTASNGFTLNVQSGVNVVAVAADDRPVFPGLPATPQSTADAEFPTIPNPQDVFSDSIGLDNSVIRGALDIVIGSSPAGPLLDAITAFNQVFKAVSGLFNAFSGTTFYTVGTDGAEDIDYGVDPSNLNPALSEQAYIASLGDVQGTVQNLAIDFSIGLLTNLVKFFVGGAHVVFAGNGNDQINGHSGTWDDFFDGGGGADTMSGGKGNDVYLVNEAGDVVVESANQGTDTVRLTGNFAYTLANNVENLFNVGFFGATGNSLNNYIEGNGDGNAIAGGAGNDTISGGAGGDILDGQAGTDLLFGGAGDDTYVYDGVDVIYEGGNAGTDGILFRGLSSGAANGQSVDLAAIEAAGLLFGSVENITLDAATNSTLNFNAAGNSLNNRIQGNQGNNLLEGRDGNDTLLGGAESLGGADGIDTLEGGAGDDTYLVRSTDDVIFDVDGNDTIKVSATATRITDDNGSLVGFTDQTFTYVMRSTSVIETLVLGEIGLSEVDQRLLDNRNDPDILAATGRVAIAGPNQDFDAVAGLGNNLIVGNAGNNDLTARAGNDTLQGGEGNDTLRADSGSDTTAGVAGDSRLEGGKGDDTYLLFREGDVVIELANEGTDVIRTSVVDVTLTAGSFVENIELTGSLDLDVTGSDSANTIVSNDGNNLVVAGGGNDQLDQRSNFLDQVLSVLPRDVINYLKFTDADGNYDFAKVLSAIQAILPTGVSLPEGDADDVLRSLAERAVLLAEAELIIANLPADLRAEYFESDFEIAQGELAPQPFRLIVDEVLGTLNISRSNDVFEVVADRIAVENGGAATQLDAIYDALPKDLLNLLLIDDSPIVTAQFGATGDFFFSQIEVVNRINDLLPFGLDIGGRATISDLSDIANRVAELQEYDLIIGQLTDEQFTAFAAQEDGFNAPIDFRSAVTEILGEVRDIQLSFYNAVLSRRSDLDNLDERTERDKLVDSLDPDIVRDIFAIRFADIDGSLSTLIADATDGRVSLTDGVTDQLIADLRNRLDNNDVDTLQGGEGDDTYFINDRADVVTELANQGTDTIVTTLEDFTLGANFEVLVLESGTIGGINNGADGTLRGNAENNYLVSGQGADTLEGLGGDDTYVVNDTSDVIQEALNSGVDRVLSSETFTLGANIENLQLTGVSDIDGTGNSLGNVIIGNDSDNRLDGGEGADSLEGGRGNDTLISGEDLIVDTLDGGFGDDTYRLSGLFSSVEDIIIDAGGNDTIEMAAFGRLDAFQISGAIENITLFDGGSGGTTIDVDGNFAANRILGNGELNIGQGFGGNDTITGGNIVLGGTGNDVLGGNRMYGGEGNDTFQVSDNSQLVADSSGTDTVEASVTYVADAGLRALLIDLLGESDSTTRTTAEMLASAQSIAAADGFSSSISNTFFTFLQEIQSISVDSIENITLTGEGTIDATGNGAANTIKGNDAANKLEGGAGNDTLEGNGGNDTLDGGEGADQLSGGAGDDTYIIDDSDTITEAADGGTDTVFSDSDIDLSSFSNLENATLSGSNNTDVTGDGGNNILSGNSGNNILSGGEGADTLIGGSGNDTYVVNSTDDSVVEEANQGTDTIQVNRTVDLDSEFANIENATLTDDVTTADLSGDDNNNVLTGNSSANTLDGRGGNDTLVGGDGGDTYVVNSSGDVVSESGSSGTDLVQSSITYTLGSGLENLTLTGSDDIDATGNTGNNTLTGNSGDNVFVGGGGNNSFVGGAGDDTFNVGTFDNVTEVREFRVTENQTLIGSVADLFDAPILGPNDTITYELFGEDRDLFDVDENGLVTFVGGPDFENPGDDGGDNVYELTISATQTTPGVNRLPFGNSAFNVTVTDEVIETISVIAGAGNEKVVQLVVDGSGTQYAIVEGGDLFTVTAGGEVRFVSSQQFVEGADPLIVKISVTQNGVTNVVTQAVQVTENPDGRVDTINRVKSVNITPLEDVSSDTIRVSDPTFSVTIDDEVENLILDSTDGEILNGNERDNVITGNAGNDTIDGKEGADTLKGGAGDDTYTLDSEDVIEELSNQGTDTVNASESYTLSGNLENLTLTGSDDINGTGNSDANTITGNSGSNTLSGGGGNDTLLGGLGDDTFVVNNTGVTLSEGVNQGTDTIQTSLNTFSLIQDNFNSTSTIQVENLIFTSSGNNSGTGNALDNQLTGNSGNDSLDGREGNDTLIGGAGDDRYTVDSTGDVVTENAGEGTDLVLTSVDYTLGANVENLFLLGTADIDGTGNELDNSITGNSGANELRGLGGADFFFGVDPNDTVDGGDGQDGLFLDGGELDLTESQNLTSIEVFVLEGGGNKLTADETSVNDIAGGTLFVAGESSDQVILKGDWTKISDNTTVQGLTVDTYQFGSTSTQAVVQDGIDVRVINIQPSISVDDLDGSNGFTIQAGTDDSFEKFVVSSVGDLDGDGFGDVAVGLERNYSIEYSGSYYTGGRAYVVFGDSGIGSTLSLDDIDGSNGFTLLGYDSALGSSLTAADIDGDGTDDLLVGDYNAGSNVSSGNGNGREGQTFAVFGGDSFANEVTASDLATPGNADGAVLSSLGVGSKSGKDIAKVGDFNGDGIDDFVISGHYKTHDSDREGSAYVVFGTESGFDGTINLEDLDGTNGLEITATTKTSSQVGFNVSTAGDINGDGFDDVMLTSNFNSRTFVIFGTDSGAEAIDVDDLDNSNGFQLYYGGDAIAGGGDINGDGFDDLVVGSEEYGAFVLFGAADMASVMSQLVYDDPYFESNTLFALNPDPAYGGDGTLGFHVVDELPYYGGFSSSVAMLGDINGDGFDDFIVADYRKDLGGGAYGEAFVIFGGPTGHDGLINVNDLDGTNGFKITSSSGYYLGQSVSAAGDVNGDGFNDIVLGERGTGSYNNKLETDVYDGNAFVIYGKDFAGDAGVIGSSGQDTLSGGTDSVIRAGSGDDFINIDATDFFRIDGGGGSDVLNLDGTGLVLNFDNLQDRAVRNVETINLTGTGNNTLTIDHLQAGDALGSGLTLQVDGNAGDIVNLPRGAVVSTDGSNNTYTRFNTTISVANTVTVNQLEYAPQFFNSSTLTVDENTTIVDNLIARDRNGDDVTYSITGGDDQSFFTINATTGELSFTNAPNFENPQSPDGAFFDNTYEVIVTATDDSSGTLATNHAITVSVADVEDAPVITTGTQFPNINIDGLIANALIGTVMFTATDEDSSSVTFSISGDDANSFGIVNSSTVPGTYNATLRVGSGGVAANDADGDRVYEFVLTATDAEGNQTSQNIEIGLTRDANRLPQFDVGNDHSVTITEGTGVDVGTFTATDFDNPAEDIRYSLSDDQGGLFAIDAITGALTFTGSYSDAVDPAANTYSLTLEATDNAGGGETGTSALTVTVAFDVPTTTNADANALPVLANFTTDNAGEILDFTTLLSGATGLDNSDDAFKDGYLNFRFFGSDIIVEFDADGGGDDYLGVLRVTGGAGNLDETDTDFLIL